jgi:hypothetical protein
MKGCRNVVLAVVVLGMVAAVALVAWVALGQGAREMGRAAVPTRRSSTLLLSLGNGRGDEVSDDFTVPAGCTRQELAYEGTALDDEVSWVSFRAVDANGRGQGSVGPNDLLTAPEGSGMLSLSPGVHAIEVESWEAEWRYTLKCR